MSTINAICTTLVANACKHTMRGKKKGDAILALFKPSRPRTSAVGQSESRLSLKRSLRTVTILTRDLCKHHANEKYSNKVGPQKSAAVRNPWVDVKKLMPQYGPKEQKIESQDKICQRRKDAENQQDHEVQNLFKNKEDSEKR